jgi:hypothetical protein
MTASSSVLRLEVGTDVGAERIGIDDDGPR